MATPRRGALTQQEPQDRRPPLGLVVDIEGHRQQQHQALDDLGQIGANAHELQAVVQYRHHQATDHRTDDRAHPAGDRRATDEDRRDGVQLPTDAVKGAGGGGTADEHESCQRGEDGHVHHHQEGDAAGIDPGEARRLTVAAHGIDVAAEDGVPGEKAVQDHQADQDQSGDREGGPRPAAGELIGQPGNDDTERHQPDDRGTQGWHLAPQTEGSPPGAPGPQHQPEDGGQAEGQGRIVQARVIGEGGQVPPAQVLDVVGHGDGVGVTEGLVGPAKQHHPSQGDDEGGDADIGHPEALPGADEGANAQAQQHRGPGRQPPVAHRQGQDNTGKGGHGAYGQVDVASDDHQNHADGQYQDIGVAIEQIHQIGRGQDQPFGLDLEKGHQGDEGEDHTELAGVATKQVLEIVHGRGPQMAGFRGVARLRVISRIRRS